MNLVSDGFLVGLLRVILVSHLILADLLAHLLQRDDTLGFNDVSRQVFV